MAKCWRLSAAVCGCFPPGGCFRLGGGVLQPPGGVPRTLAYVFRRRDGSEARRCAFESHFGQLLEVSRARRSSRSRPSCTPSPGPRWWRLHVGGSRRGPRSRPAPADADRARVVVRVVIVDLDGHPVVARARDRCGVAVGRLLRRAEGRDAVQGVLALHVALNRLSGPRRRGSSASAPPGRRGGRPPQDAPSGTGHDVSAGRNPVLGRGGQPCFF